jgi:hypothetical protein
MRIVLNACSVVAGLTLFTLASLGAIWSPLWPAGSAVIIAVVGIGAVVRGVMR